MGPPKADVTALRTTGNGTLAAEAFACLLDEADVERLCRCAVLPGQSV
jgi:hypothetical protein